MSVRPTIEQFDRALDAYPAGFTGNRLNLLFLDDAEIIPDGASYLRRLDDLDLLDERREYLLQADVPWPFPRIAIDERPDPWRVSEALFQRFDEARRLLPTQGDIAEIISHRVRRHAPSVVALIIADGLSYYDLPEDQPAEPCLVDGITTTEFGYRRVLGQPEISRRLFNLGYAQQLGFTYFSPDTNDLSRDLYSTLAPSQIHRISAFDQVMDHVRGQRFSRAYIQITMSGLDQLSHAHFDRPPRDHYLQRIIANYQSLIECLSAEHERLLVALTADHGILWREVIEPRLEIVDDLFQEDMRSPRYVRGSVMRRYGYPCRSGGKNYTLFGVPWMTRGFRNNEWGVHGGISAWESIVPLMIHES
jgi:hypothetical protein